MRVWRLANSRYAELDGEGARLYGGRWNNPGTPLIYAATHVSLALLEQLVHLGPERLPATLRAFMIDVPDDTPPETATSGAEDMTECRRYGDEWAASRRSAALIVASVIVPSSLDPGEIATAERNVLLNPKHASAGTWRAVETSFRVDPRLRRLARG